MNLLFSWLESFLANLVLESLSTIFERDNWQQLIAEKLVEEWNKVILYSGGKDKFKVVLSSGDPYLIQAIKGGYRGVFVEFFRIELCSNGTGAFVFFDQGREVGRFLSDSESIIELSTDELLAKIADCMRVLSIRGGRVSLGF